MRELGVIIPLTQQAFVLGKFEDHIKWQNKNEEMHQEMFATLERLSSGWSEPYYATLRRPLTEEELEKVNGFREQLRNNPDSDSYYDSD